MDRQVLHCIHQKYCKRIYLFIYRERCEPISNFSEIVKRERVVYTTRGVSAHLYNIILVLQVSKRLYNISGTTTRLGRHSRI